MDDRDLSGTLAGTLAFIEAHTAVHKTCRALHLRHQREKLMDDRDLSGTLAFIEAHTTVHKTCRALHLRHQFLPLVAPAIGVTSDLWGEGWLQCRSECRFRICPNFHSCLLLLRMAHGP